MKEHEEREQNGATSPDGEKGTDPAEGAKEPDSVAPGEASAGALGGSGEGSTSVGNLPPGEKEPQACEIAQGALGQVKAKVEVCKDESVGKDQLNMGSFTHSFICDNTTQKQAALVTGSGDHAV